MTVKQVLRATTTASNNNNNLNSSGGDNHNCCCCCCASTIKGLEKNILKKAFKKCCGVMRLRLQVDKKMLSVVSAGAAAGMGGMDRLRGGGGGGGRAAARELAASRDRQVRLHAVRTDLALNLPPSLALPDGEDHRHLAGHHHHHHHHRHHHRSAAALSSAAAASRLQIRDAEQESEIYQKCIRPPPNRTVMESESPPPFRSHSGGVSTSCSSSGSSDSSSIGSGSIGMKSHLMSSSTSSTTLKSAYHQHHHHHSTQQQQQQGGQKTDFLQRTVKIFTGSKKTPSVNNSITSSQSEASTAPCVAVPAASMHASNQSQQRARRDASPV